MKFVLSGVAASASGPNRKPKQHMKLFSRGDPWAWALSTQGHIWSRVYNCTKAGNRHAQKFNLNLALFLESSIKKILPLHANFPMTLFSQWHLSPIIQMYKGGPTTATAQFTIFNCNFPFTTAEIWHNYPLKYALVRPCYVVVTPLI